MEIEIIEKSGNSIKLKIIGESHTLCNALKGKLADNKDVTFVGYRKEHPLLDYSIFTLKTKKGNAEETLMNAVKEIEEELNGLKKELK